VGSQKELVINIFFVKPVDLHTIGLSSLRIGGQQILLAKEITVLGGAVKNKLKVLGRVKPELPANQNSPDTKKVIECKIQAAQPLNYIQIRIKPVIPSPSWFPPQKQASFFIDELFFN